MCSVYVLSVALLATFGQSSAVPASLGTALQQTVPRSGAYLNDYFGPARKGREIEIGSLQNRDDATPSVTWKEQVDHEYLRRRDPLGCGLAWKRDGACPSHPPGNDGT